MLPSFAWGTSRMPADELECLRDLPLRRSKSDPAEHVLSHTTPFYEIIAGERAPGTPIQCAAVDVD